MGGAARAPTTTLLSLHKFLDLVVLKGVKAVFAVFKKVLRISRVKPRIGDPPDYRIVFGAFIRRRFGSRREEQVERSDFRTCIDTNRPVDL
jgi:hypothetical protein